MLKQCDKLSPPITLYYKNQDRHSSSLSGCLTIIAYLIIVILAIIFSLDFLLKMNPTSYFYYKFVQDTGIFYFNSSGIFHFIATGEQVNINYDDRTFSIIGVEKEYDVILENNSQINFDHWIYSPCSDIDINHLKKYLNDYNTSFSNGLCIDKFYNSTSKTIINKKDKNFNYPILKHGNSNLNGNTYGIFIIRCQNHSEINKTNCYDSNKSDEYAIDSLSFAIYFIDQYIDVTDFHYPLIKFYNKVRNQIVLSSFTVNHLNLKPLQLNTHTGLILNKNEYLNSFNFDVNEKLTINQENTGIYGSFYFWMQNQMGIYDRKYQKIQDICASISGLSKMVMLIGYCFNYLIYEITLIEDLTKDINKKTEKFGRKTTLKGFSNSINFSNIFNTPQTPYTFINKKASRIISPNHNIGLINQTHNIYNVNTLNHFNNNINNNINNNGNNIYETSVSKINLNPSKKSLQLKENISCIQIIKNKFLIKKNSVIQQVINTRMKVLSEQKLFTNYYILGSLSDKLLKQTNTQINNYVIENIENKIKRKYEFSNIPSKTLYKREMTLNT